MDQPERHHSQPHTLTIWITVCFTSSFLVLVILLLSSFAANGGSETTRAHGDLKQKPCHLHFKFHDILDGRNATAVRVTNPPMVTVIDDLLTEGPELTSTPVGREQGFYASACLQEVASLRAMDLVFGGGKYNGSMLTVLGRNAPLHEVKRRWRWSKRPDASFSPATTTWRRLIGSMTTPVV